MLYLHRVDRCACASNARPAPHTVQAGNPEPIFMEQLVHHSSLPHSLSRTTTVFAGTVLLRAAGISGAELSVSPSFGGWKNRLRWVAGHNQDSHSHIFELEWNVSSLLDTFRWHNIATVKSDEITGRSNPVAVTPGGGPTSASEALPDGVAHIIRKSHPACRGLMSVSCPLPFKLDLKNRIARVYPRILATVIRTRMPDLRTGAAQ